MRLSVNDREKMVGEGVETLQALLDELHYSVPLFVVRVNERLVERADYAATRIAEGDRIDVYNLVAGG